MPLVIGGHFWKLDVPMRLDRVWRASLREGPLTGQQPKDEGGEASPEQRFLDEVRRSGRVNAAAKAAGVTTKTAKRWIDRDPAFKERYEEAMAEFRDTLEERLMNRIDRGGNGAALRFKLKAEMPEKYGLPGKLPPKEEPGDGPDWGPVEREAESREE